MYDNPILGDFRGLIHRRKAGKLAGAISQRIRSEKLVQIEMVRIRELSACLFRIAQLATRPRQIGPEAVYTAIKSVIIAGEYAKEAGWKSSSRSLMQPAISISSCPAGYRKQSPSSTARVGLVAESDLGLINGGFLKWGYPQSSSILMAFSIINHPAIGAP